MSTDAQVVPTTKDEFTSRRSVAVTLPDGSVLLFRRISVRDLFLREALPSELVSAVDSIRTGLTASDRTTEEMAEALRTTRDGLERVAIYAAIAPPISKAEPPADAPAIWVDLLETEELLLIFSAVTGTYQPMGAAAAEAFRGGEPSAAADPAPAGEDVRPAPEPLPAGGSGDVVDG